MLPDAVIVQYAGLALADGLACLSGRGSGPDGHLLLTFNFHYELRTG